MAASRRPDRTHECRPRTISEQAISYGHFGSDPVTSTSPTLGRRASTRPPSVVQHRFGEGPIEDSPPPRFANQVGFVILTAATGAYIVGKGDAPRGCGCAGLVVGLQRKSASSDGALTGSLGLADGCHSLGRQRSRYACRTRRLALRL